jgi:hypothetical protein
MPPRKKRRDGPNDPLEAYRRIRKPMPPPERVIPDRRREIEERRARKESEEERDVNDPGA